jgi:hypothetical protein
MRHATAVWSGEAALEAAWSLNETIAVKLVKQAETTEQGKLLPTIVASMADLWRGLNGPALHAVAHVPVLLAAARFEDEGLWTATEGGAASVGIGSWLSIEEAKPLLCTILQAAADVRDVYALRIVFGMSQRLAEWLSAGVSQHQLDMLSGRHAGLLQPRFDDCPEFYWDLLSAARAGRKQAISRCYLHATRLSASASI